MRHEGEGACFSYPANVRLHEAGRRVFGHHGTKNVLSRIDRHGGRSLLQNSTHWHQRFENS